MEAEFDLIVVGAGPGGSNAAAVALRSGLRVAQVEKYRFPRVKPCAGALSVKACRSLQLKLAPSVRYVSTAIEFNVWERRTNRFTYSTPLVQMVLRPEFDNMLVEQNLRFDAFKFFDDEPVLGLEYDGLFRVRTKNRVLTGRQLVGADGAYSLVNRVFKISNPAGFATAVEVNLDSRSAEPRGPVVPCVDFAAVEKGYGWVFPKDGYWSVGLYTLARGIKDLRHRLADYIRAKGFEVEGDPLASFVAHKLPVGGFDVSVPDAPVYLVGDAGGFADAITGEGIYHALESGRLAGETVCEVHKGRGSHRRYYRRLRKSVLADTYLSYQLARAFYYKADNAVRILESPLIWRPFVEGYARGATLLKIVACSGIFYLKSVIGRRSKRHVSFQQDPTRDPPPSLSHILFWTGVYCAGSLLRRVTRSAR